MSQTDIPIVFISLDVDVDNNKSIVIHGTVAFIEISINSCGIKWSKCDPCDRPVHLSICLVAAKNVVQHSILVVRIQ